nr:hypothetical protein [Desulfobacula sp.]
MVLSIRNDISAQISRRYLGRTDGGITSSLERMSTGLRINKAADDSSGMMIADSLRAQAQGLGQVIRNANDAVSIVQVADAALEESIHILNTIKAKSIQAAQDGQTLESRQAIQSDIQRLMAELDEISDATSFNGQKLLSGGFSNKSFQIGAYSGEAVSLSIGSASSSQIGHLYTGKLTLDDNREGLVSIGIQSRSSNRCQVIQPMEMAYDNTPEHGLGALADAINKLTDLTGVRAFATVTAHTDSSLSAGTTDTGFSINSVKIGSIRVLANDADGALVKAINSKIALHGVEASVGEDGRLILTSTDGRGIRVEPEPGRGTGIDGIFKGKNLTTFGELQVQGSGGTLAFNDLGGGDPVAVQDNGLDIKTNAVTGQGSTLARGSVLAPGSVINSTWTADQTLWGSRFQEPILIREQTLMKEGSILGKGSVLITSSDLPSTLMVKTDSQTEFKSLIKQGSLLKKDSILGQGTELPPGEIVSAGTVFNGAAWIEGTLDTSAPSLIKAGSVLEAGTVIASGSVLKGPVSVGATGSLNGSALIRTGSVLRAGSIIGSGTTLGGNAVIAGIANTTGAYSLAAGSVLATGSVIASGTVLGGNAVVGLVIGTTGDYDLATNSILRAGSVISSGAVLTGTAVITATGPTTGNFNLASGSVLTAGSVLGSGTLLTQTATISTAGPVTGDYVAGTGSTLAAGTVFGDGTVLNGTATVNQITGPPETESPWRRELS